MALPSLWMISCWLTDKEREQGDLIVGQRDPGLDPRPSWVRDAGGIHDRTLLENWLFRLRRERFRSRASGNVHDFYVTHIADGVHVVAITPDRNVVMVRQFRAGANKDSLETPGGLVAPGEDPCPAGARELLEETGYAGERPEMLGTLYPNPALLTMRIATIVVRDVRRVAPPQPDRSEELVIELVPIADIPELIASGKIDHAVCVAGLLWWQRAATRPVEE
jgi:8-oxo-dGTP pyrophosphatase MutT (NUDIX family)